MDLVTTKLQYLNKLTGITFSIYNKDGSIQETVPSTPEYMKIARGWQQDEKIRQLWNELRAVDAQKQGVLLKHISPVYYFIVMQCPRAECMLIAGPVSSSRFTEESAVCFSSFIGLTDGQITEFVRTCMKAPPISYQQILALIHTMYMLINDNLLDDTKIFIDTEMISLTEVAMHTVREVFKNREEGISHSTYDYERGILEAIRLGDIKMLEKAAMRAYGSVGSMSHNSLRQTRYSFIAYITMITRAAIEGGVEEETAYTLSDVLCRKMDQMNTQESINELSAQSAYKFIEKVQEVSENKLFSPVVQKCCDYIHTHLHQKISMKDIEQYMNMAARTLSERFKKETGLTIIEYVNLQKINEAKSLLKYTDYSINEISNYLMFATQSYFTALFKKSENITPQAYRDAAHFQRAT